MGRVVKSEENGIETETEYDFLGRDFQTTTTEAGKAAVITTKVYNANSVLISETSNIGVTKSYVYDNRNRLIKTTTTGTDIETNISITSYGYGENVQIHDGKGITTEAVTYKETTKDTAGNVIGITYTDALGNTVKEISGNTYTDYSFDAGGNGVVTYEGNNSDNTFLVSMTLYDQEGRNFAEITNPAISGEDYMIGDESVVTYTSYDPKGNVETETDALGVVTSYSYNEEGQLVATDIANDGADISVDYYTLENGQESVWVTDANNNRKKELTDANGATVQTEDVSDTGSVIATYSYDENGRKVAEVYGEQNEGQNAEQKLPYKEYTYEGTSDRIQTEIEYRLGGTLDGGTIYEYDAWNRLITVLHKEGNKTVCEYHYTYDVNGNVLTESVSYSSESAKITAYEYDAEGRLVKITYPSQSELGVVEYKYDSDGKLTKILQNNKTVREYSYDGFERVIAIKDYNESGSSSYILKSYVYDKFGRCVSMVYTENGNSQNVLESYEYSYDKNGNIISETRISNLPSEDQMINETRDYIYDAYGRLTQSTITDHTAADVKKVTSYEYDGVGNRTKMTVDGIVTEYSYNELNQLTESVSPAAEIKYTYDKYGNQIKESNETTGEVTEMDYSVSGEMVQLVKMNGTTTELIQKNTYNQNGIRISRSQSLDGSNIYFDKEYYYNNGVVAYTENSNTLSSANIQSIDGSVIGTYRGKVYHNYLKNIQGSTASIVDEDRGVSAVYRYTDFGETEEVVADTIENEICYTGAIYDKDTGLYYMNARYYNAVTGRFISQDSYRGEIEDEGTWHLYAYCANNPINYVDPTGHSPAQILGAIAGGIGGAALGKMLADELGLKGTKRKALIAAATVGGAALGAFLGPYVAKLGVKLSAKLGVGSTIKISSSNLWKRSAKHIFSKAHIKDGIMKLGKSQKSIFNKIYKVVKRNLPNAVNGSNQIHTTISGTKVTIRFYVSNGQVQSMDAFTGWATRIIGKLL